MAVSLSFRACLLSATMNRENFYILLKLANSSNCDKEWCAIDGKSSDGKCRIVLHANYESEEEICTSCRKIFNRKKEGIYIWSSYSGEVFRSPYHFFCFNGPITINAVQDNIKSDHIWQEFAGITIE